VTGTCSTPQVVHGHFALISLRGRGLMSGRMAMIIGAVRWFDVPKGYGFIKPDDGGVDVLVDICAVERAGMACLDQGQRLSFELVRDERIARWRAESLNENICPVGGGVPYASTSA
jgi:CspA family cold shock protein